MVEQTRAIRPQLVIVEGIMGSGKTTTVLRTTDRLSALGIPVIGITEGVSPHPIRYDWDCSWSQVRASDLASAQLSKWQSYVAGSAAAGHVLLVDGQLFHGNLTAMFLLEADLTLMTEYCSKLGAVIAPLNPYLVYFLQNDVEAAIRAISAERGHTWVDYQTSWKLSSPYAVRRSLTGLDGLIELYRAYRATTDQLFDSLELPKLSIENSLREWSKYDRLIDQTVLRTAP